MLGRAFREALERADVAFSAPSHAELDLSAPDRIDESLPDRVGTLINCAAWTDVDAAESQEAAASQINGAAVEALAGACEKRGALLVQFSTDYVFDGEGRTPYRVNHPRAPVNAYGRSKALGETALERSRVDHLLLRTSWVYAPWGKNFVLKMLSLARSRPSLRVVGDQVGRPSSAEGIARTALALIDCGARGTLHVTDGGQCSWFELAQASIRAAGLSVEVTPCGSDEYPSPARRPAYSVLDVSLTSSLVRLEPWQQAVAGVVARATSGASR
jgi:dTDP-4-dehydrorhamnose reductase